MKKRPQVVFEQIQKDEIMVVGADDESAKLWSTGFVSDQGDHYIYLLQFSAGPVSFTVRK